jgi:hypothetical protein
MENTIKRFFHTEQSCEGSRIADIIFTGKGWGSGKGSGGGDNSGYGSGYGNGNGSGNGKGDGYGSGSGYDSGYGNGNGSKTASFYHISAIDYKVNGFKSDQKYALKALHGQAVWYVDDIPCIIYSVKGNMAKAGIIQDDFSLKPCYIAKYNNVFAHGETAKDARREAEKKFYSELSFEDTLEAFKKEVSREKSYPVRYFFDWHGRLTGSCSFGRKRFAEDHVLDLDKSRLTLCGFFDLTRDAYGGDKIRRVENELMSGRMLKI